MLTTLYYILMSKMCQRTVIWIMYVSCRWLHNLRGKDVKFRASYPGDNAGDRVYGI